MNSTPTKAETPADAPPHAERSRDIASMFDRISSTYDLLNHLFSLGIDRRWRNLAIRHMHLQRGMRILDCSAGTGDMSMTAHRHCDGVSTVLLDPAHAMLAVADTKGGVLRPRQYALVQGVAETLPFASDHFDRFMVAFGIRNFADLESGLRELHRILKPGGRGAILEFTPDRSRLIDRMFRWYMRHVMRTAGAIISRDRGAYAYLHNTVQGFRTSVELEELYQRIGFRCAESRPLSFGIARLFILDKV